MCRILRYAAAGIGDKCSLATTIISRFQLQTFRGMPSQRYRWIPRLQAGLVPSINSILLLLPLLLYGPNVQAATENAFYLDLGMYRQEGLEPLEVWNAGTGYSSLKEAMAALVPAMLQQSNSCIQTNTRTFQSGVTCAFTYVGGSLQEYPPVRSVYYPSSGNVNYVVSYAILVPLLQSCNNGYSEINYEWCSGGIREKARNIPDERCPIAPLQPLPDDPCTKSLEDGRGKDINGKCPKPTNEMQQQAQCLADKITSLGIPYPGPTSTIRTGAYQAHLREIWEKLRELKRLKDPAIIQACASRKAEVEGHKTSHGLTDRPAVSDSRHESGNAVDIGNGVARELINRMTTDMSDVQDYVNSPFSNLPACNLQWGGRFRQYDWVHFQLP